MKNVTVIWALLVLGFLAGCDRVESGDPPSFSGTPTTSAVSDTQIAVRWSAGSDDLDNPADLTYSIWYGTEAPDLTQAPNITTAAGALSYNLVNLNANTTYQVVVRVRDRGLNESSNETAVSQMTAEAGLGNYLSETQVEVTRAVNDIIAAKVTGSLEDVGLVSGNRIFWYGLNSSGAAEERQDRVEVNFQILVVKAAVLRSGQSSDDLVMVSDAGELSISENNGSSDYDAPQVIADNVADRPNLVVQDLDADGDVDIAYLDATSFINVLLNDGDGVFEAGLRLRPNNFAFSFAFATLNDDNHQDLVLFGGDGLQILTAGNDHFVFDQETNIDSLVRDPDIHALFAADGNGDGLDDIYVFTRDATEDLTQLTRWINAGSANFSASAETDYSGAPYRSPAFGDVDGDGVTDLIFTQTSANNVVVYTAGSGAFNQISSTVGGDGQVQLAQALNLNGNTRMSFAFLSTAADALTIVPSSSN